MARRLDRLVEFDERSRKFPVRMMLAEAVKPRSHTWKCAANLDQGEEGACVGFAWAHELAAKPVAVKEATNKLAFKLYKQAQKLDQWEGHDYEGTSVLGGAKAVRKFGYVTEYRWAFGLEDLILAVGHAGPAVIGVNWYEAMFEPRNDGYLRVKGELAGGHAILVRGVDMKKDRFLLHNSWGAGWGDQGTAWLSFDDMHRLLHEDGEACIPVVRKQALTA